MRLKPTSIAAIGILAASVAAVAPCAAQQLQRRTGPPPASDTLQVYTRETIVDVTVTDDHGNHVRGLKRSDFTIQEDGSTQPLRSFKETGLTRAAVLPPKLPAGTYTSAQTTPAAGPATILLIDSWNSPPLGPAYMELVVTAQHEVEHYIQAMPEGTPVAIFSLSFRGLRLLQGFTSDRELLFHAMDTNFLVLAGDDRPNLGRDKYFNLDALNQIAAYLAPIKGRKNLLWLAPGSPVLLLRDGGLSWTEGPPDLNYIHRVMDTYELFTAEQIAVSPVDTRGAGVLGRSTLAMEAVADDTGGVAYYNNNDIKGEIAKAIDDSSDYYTLSYTPPPHTSAGHAHKITVTVARPGLHLVYRKGYNDEQPPPNVLPAGPPLMKASMEGQAPPAAQLKFNVSIQTANGPLVPAHAAKSGATEIATIPDPFADSDDPFAFADSFATPAPPAAKTPPATQPPAANAAPAPQSPSADPTITPGRRPVTSKEKTRYTFLFSVPPSQIAFTARPDGTRTAALEFDVAAYDEFGHLINGISQTMHMPLTADEYAEFIELPFQFSQQLDLPPGAATLHVGILDPTSNKVGTLELQITVPKTHLDAPVATAASTQPSP
jgi:VWFA-related protein